MGYQPDVAYNVALCHYKVCGFSLSYFFSWCISSLKMKQFGPALKYLGEIIERGVREHPG